ncbi:DUF2510 domain-containing protein [Leucobacter sp.]
MTYPPAAWYEDPEDRFTLRYWDGSAWTEHTAPHHQALALAHSTRLAEQRAAGEAQKQAAKDQKLAARSAKIESREAETARKRGRHEQARSEKAESKALKAQAVAASLEESRRLQAEAEAKEEELWGDSVHLGSPIRPAAMRSLLAHCVGDERPWLTIHSSFAGVLAAFEDRLVIIKTGAMTGLGAGALGGGRHTTFFYSDITGIEYNAQILTGVLEILTPSYQGTANQDYWRGAGRSTNANTGNPFTLSNTLPLNKSEYAAASEQINELRRRVAHWKRPHHQVAAPQLSIAEEIERLVKLRDAQAISEEEFLGFKAHLLGKRE